jgi:hypothetical protein
MVDTRTEIFKRSAKKLLRTLFVDYFYLTLVAIGILVLFAPSVFVPKGQDPTWAKISGHVGDAILTAGAVTTFMRFFASLDIVGERIEKWLTSDEYVNTLTTRLTEAVYDPQKLPELGALTVVWRKISLAITRDAFPNIANSVYEKTLNQILKACADYYYESYRRVTQIVPAKDGSDFVEIEHELQLSVVANQNNPSARFKTILKLDEFTDGAPVVSFFQVDGVAQAFQTTPIGVATNQGMQYQLEADLPLGRPVKISYAYRLKQSLSIDPFLLWTTTRYVGEARCEVSYPDELIECDYQDTAFEPLLQADGGNRAGRLVYTSGSTGLIFPGSAFILIVRRKRKEYA